MVKIMKKNVLKTKELKFKKDILESTLKQNLTTFFTLQFIHPSKRQKMFDKIFKGLNWWLPFF